jgi:hypothetical protein
LIDECEAIERNIGLYETEEEKKKAKKQKSKNGKSAGEEQKNGSKKNSKEFFCKKCGRNNTHNTERCWVLKREAGGNKSVDKKPFSKRTFRKEANAIARLAAKKGSLKILEKSLARQQSKAAKSGSKGKSGKKSASSESESDSDESLNVIETQIPRKTKDSPVTAAKKKTKVSLPRDFRSVDDPFEDDSAEQRAATKRCELAKRMKALALKKLKKKSDTAAAEEAAFLAATAAKEAMETDDTEDDDGSIMSE